MNSKCVSKHLYNFSVEGSKCQINMLAVELYFSRNESDREYYE